MVYALLDALCSFCLRDVITSIRTDENRSIYWQGAFEDPSRRRRVCQNDTRFKGLVRRGNFAMIGLNYEVREYIFYHARANLRTEVTESF
jgi:hypothetical protein